MLIVVFFKKDFLCDCFYSFKFLKRFYTLNKTLLVNTGCLSKFYYLLAAQASSFLIPPFPKHSQLGHLWYTTTHCAVHV